MKGLLLLAVLGSAVPFYAQTATSKPNFPVFDAASSGFSQAPDLKQYGLKTIVVVYPNFMWKDDKLPNDASLPDVTRVKAFAQLANQTTRTLAIDIEHWPVTGDHSKVADTVKKFQTVIGWYKLYAPSLTLGVYGVVPIEDYADSLQPEDSPRYRAWQKKNDDLAPIVQSVDVLFPSIYTFYDDRAAWQKYAIAQIREARRYKGGKPVYAFIWPQYRGVDKKLGNSFIPGDFWRLQLETAYKYADGVVIWCCMDHPEWNDAAPWWLETKQFVKEVNSGAH